MFDVKKQTTVRTVNKGKDGLWYVCKRGLLGGWKRESKGYQHSTSAWAELGKLTASEQSE